jgi:hypothetical protein
VAVSDAAEQMRIRGACYAASRLRRGKPSSRGNSPLFHLKDDFGPAAERAAAGHYETPACLNLMLKD